MSREDGRRRNENPLEVKRAGVPERIELEGSKPGIKEVAVCCDTEVSKIKRGLVPDRIHPKLYPSEPNVD